jgi:Family of unknown function (DUF5694)
MKRPVPALAALAAALPALAQAPSALGPAQPAARAEVLVLGVYHMANPGRDIYNMPADDVLAPKRQTEIAQLTEVLKRFRPTRVAVERDVSDDRLARDYADYVAETHELTRNEIEQVGFRLARELGHKTVYPVDADGEFPYPRLVNYGKASGRAPELDAVMAGFGAMVKEQGEYLASHTVLETLLYMNAEERVVREVGLYYRLAHFGEPGDWAGADLLADWFRRNMRIFSNVTRLADAPNERVLMVFGAGHLGWLRQAVSSDPALRLRTLAEFVK